MENQQAQKQNQPSSQNKGEQNSSAQTNQPKVNNQVEGSEVDYKVGNSPYSDFNTDKPLEEGKSDKKNKESSSPED